MILFILQKLFFWVKCDLFIYFKNIFYHITFENIFRILNNSYIFRKSLCVTSPLKLDFINSVVHGPTMGHPNKRAVRELGCYESVHENTSFLFVHVITHSCKSVVLFHVKIKIKSTFKINSKQFNFFLIQNLSITNMYTGILELTTPMTSC